MARKQIPAMSEFELEDEKPISMRRLWLKEHKTAIYIGAAILLIVAVFFGIRIYNNAAHPITKFMRASAKNFNSSFSFKLEAHKDGKTVMQYNGVYSMDPSKMDINALYDADYGKYTYKGVVYTEGDTYVNGNQYDGEWRLHDCTEKALNFFDFNTDYRKGSFDGASFLRFTELTSQYSANELNSFMKLFKSRMDGNSPLSKVEITSKGKSKTYSYDINMKEFFDLVRDKGASIFFSAIDYDAFCALYQLNEKSVSKAACRFTYTIDGAGWLADFSLTLSVGGEEYAVTCTMDDFGTAKVEIPDEISEAAITD